MAYPHTTYNVLRLYDRMVADWVRSLQVDYGNIGGKAQSQRDILWIYSGAPQAFSNMRTVLKKRNFLGTATGSSGKEADDWVNVPLPFASIQRSDPVFDSNRAHIPFQFKKFQRDVNWYVARRFPLPYDITYTTEYWYANPYTRAYIIEWVMGQISPIGAAPNEFFMTCPFGDPWGTKMIPVQSVAITDNSDLTPGDEDDVQYRTTLEFTLKAWVFPPTEIRTPIALRIITDYDVTSRSDVELGEWAHRERVVEQDYDVLDKLERYETDILETTGGVTQADTVFDFADGSGFRTVDVPVLCNELVRWGVKVSSCTTPSLLLSAQDGIGNVLFQTRMVTASGNAECTLDVLTNDTHQVRLFVDAPVSGTVTLDTFSLTHYSIDYADSPSAITESDVEDGSASSWYPETENVDKPVYIAFDDSDHPEGNFSLLVSTDEAGQGVEKTYQVEKNQLIAFRIQLKGTVGTLELSVEDCDFPESRQTLNIPVSESWMTTGLTIKSASGNVRLSVVRKDSGLCVTRIDAVTGRVLTTQGE